MKSKIRSLFIIIALESLAASIFLFLLPKDPNNSALLGLSFQRLLIILITLAIGGFFVVFSFQTGRVSKIIDKIIEISWIYKILLGILLLFAATAFLLSQIPMDLISITLQNAYQRFQPTLYFIWIVCLQLGIFLYLSKEKITLDAIRKYEKDIFVAGGVSAFLIIVFITIQITHFGLHPDIIGWGKPTPPILFWQILLSLAIAVISAIIINKLSQHIPKTRYIQFLIPVLIYIFTVVLWAAQPFQTSYFAPRVRPPNYEVYPYSDAMFYSASAENVLTGNGFLGWGNNEMLSWQVTPRPYYISLLAYFIFLAQDDYFKLIFIQTLLLALIPVTGFFIGKKIHGNALGVFIALLLIFKEINTIQATQYISVSQSKLLLADQPTQLVVLGLSLVVIMYLQATHNKNKLALVAGGCVGLAMLFRTQSILFLPIILIIDWLKNKKVKTWIPSASLMVVGALLTISPWMIRNFVHTGAFVFDSQMGLVSGRYQFDSTNTINPDENTLPSEGKIDSVINVISNSPTRVLSFFGSHFINNELTSLMTFAPQPVISSIPYLFEKTTIWEGGELTLGTPQIIFECVILIIIACGYILAYRRIKLAGLIPLAIQTVYHMSNSFARNSGGRYTVPVDWVNCVYFAAGIIQIILWVSLLFESKQSSRMALTGQPIDSKLELARSNHPGLIFLVGISLVGVGCFVPFTEILFAKINPVPPDQKLLSDIGIINNTGLPTEIKEKLISSISNQGYQVFQGLELYPRFYPSNEGEQGFFWEAYSPMPTCRMGFILLDGIGVKQSYVYLHNPPDSFPSRLPAIVIGTYTQNKTGSYYADLIKAKYVILDKENPIVIEGLDEPFPNCRAQ